MLDPKYLERLPDAMVELYAQVEQDILNDMARRISTYDFYIPAARYQHEKLREMGEVEEAILQTLAGKSGASWKQLEAIFKEAGVKTVEFDDHVYELAGLKPGAFTSSEAFKDVLKSGMKQTDGLFKNLTRTTAHTATGQFEAALDRAWLQTSSGAFDANTAIRMGVKDLARQGVGAVRYPTGHTDTLEVAVRRATVTGVNQTALKLQDALADEMGSDLVEVTAHAGARPEHALWQGGIYSRSGKSKKYKGLREATGYGTGPGLGGWNCRHSFFPYFEGAPRAYTPEMLKSYEAKDYTYNGQKLTEYEAVQRQRYTERQIRRWKRENAAMGAAGLDTAESAAKIKQWQDTQADFLRQTGLKRQYDREQVAAVKAVAKSPLHGIINTRDDKMKLGLQFFAQPDYTMYHDANLRKAKRSLEAQVAAHEAKCKDPAAFYPEWGSLDPREQAGSVTHWKKEIQNFKKQLEIMQNELTRRGLHE